MPRAVSSGATPCVCSCPALGIFAAKATAGILGWEVREEGLAPVWHGLPFLPPARGEATEITCPVYSGLETSRPNVALSFYTKDIHSIKSKELKKTKQNKTETKHKESSFGPAVPPALGSQASPFPGLLSGGCIAPGSGSAEVLKGPSTAWRPFSFWLVRVVGAGRVGRDRWQGT